MVAALVLGVALAGSVPSPEVAADAPRSSSYRLEVGAFGHVATLTARSPRYVMVPQELPARRCHEGQEVCPEPFPGFITPATQGSLLCASVPTVMPPPPRRSPRRWVASPPEPEAVAELFRPG